MRKMKALTVKMETVTPTLFLYVYVINGKIIFLTDILFWRWVGVVLHSGNYSISLNY